MPISIRFTCVALLMSVSRFSFGALSLLNNGDFSLGNLGFSSGYNYVTHNTTDREYTVGTNPILFNSDGASFTDHTTGTGQMMIVNGSVTPNIVVWEQTIPVASNKTYTFGGWAASWGKASGGPSFDPSPAKLQFKVNGAVVGSTLNLPAADGQWTQFAVDWNSLAATTADITIVDLDTGFIGSDFALDDLTLFNTPEPSAITPLSLAACVASFRRNPRRLRRI